MSPYLIKVSISAIASQFQTSQQKRSPIHFILTPQTLISIVNQVYYILLPN
ncbi:hypothetical protein H6G33_17315 [Calothrix sp. FACHB-1219]|uniref:hypothetical protein n=1 Tax=unclassified Calothrix TaxID=2619626 RepID=UPI0016899F6E|nr:MULTISPECIES: hypothetical protein [unclassified Calothrix]MBD2203193.1 hypothetical protein [Calothrix sp. FACHB-168]MBD2218793.1 hypothetical protein [Calothrix sp. FACHB-1219]